MKRKGKAMNNKSKQFETLYDVQKYFEGWDDEHLQAAYKIMEFLKKNPDKLDVAMKIIESAQ